MNDIIIYSTGEYSDYDPIYYLGSKGLTQKDLDEAAKKFGDEVMAENPDDDNYDNHEKWESKVLTWLKEQGYEKVELPEIHTDYSEFPHS